MNYSDLHTHTYFCDGKDSPEDMVLSAISKGVETLGILVHSYTEFNPDESVDPMREKEFIAEIGALKEKYKGEINILCGTEADYYTTSMAEGYDYIIASVHYFKRGHNYYPIDLSPAELSNIVSKLFSGDWYAMAEEYYSLVADLPKRFAGKNIALIGHIDLVTKFNEDGALFDTSHPRYVASWQRAVDALAPFGIPFEINTGAISRGYRKTPYPEAAIRGYIRKKGGALRLSSDSHSAKNIAFMFEDFKDCILN